MYNIHIFTITNKPSLWQSFAELDARLRSDEDPVEYESEGINDGDPDMDHEEGQSAEDELDSNGSEVDAMKETRYQARDDDFEDVIDAPSSEDAVSPSPGYKE